MMYNVVSLQLMARPKIYTIDESTFDRNLTQNTAYCLGLLLSDGHLNYDRGSVQYACKTSDECLIRIILHSIKSTHPIKRYIIRGRSYSRVSISNKKLARAIIDRFQLPKLNKSTNNLFVPKIISKKLLPHFLRGYFDGDGSIWKSGNRFVCSYTGGENMMMDIRRILHDNEISSTISYRYGPANKNSCNLIISTHENIEKLFKYLYPLGAQNFLGRKYDLFVEHSKQNGIYRKTYLKLNGGGDKIKTMYLSGITQKSISDQIKIPYSTVRAHVQLLRSRAEVA